MELSIGCAAVGWLLPLPPHPHQLKRQEETRTAQMIFMFALLMNASLPEESRSGLPGLSGLGETSACTCRRERFYRRSLDEEFNDRSMAMINVSKHSCSDSRLAVPQGKPNGLQRKSRPVRGGFVFAYERLRGSFRWTGGWNGSS